MTRKSFLAIMATLAMIGVVLAAGLADGSYDMVQETDSYHPVGTPVFGEFHVNYTEDPGYNDAFSNMPGEILDWEHRLTTELSDGTFLHRYYSEVEPPVLSDVLKIYEHPDGTITWTRITTYEPPAATRTRTGIATRRP